MTDFILRRDDERVQRTYGTLTFGDELLGQILEDTDRKLEEHGEKIYGKTAIPRGRYPISITWSNRFMRFMPEIIGVPQFRGIRIHGGNSEVNTDGCPLLGHNRHDYFPFVNDCAAPNERLMEILEEAQKRGEQLYIEVV